MLKADLTTINILIQLQSGMPNIFNKFNNIVSIAVIITIVLFMQIVSSANVHAANLFNKHVWPKDDAGARVLYLSAVDHFSKGRQAKGIDSIERCIKLFDHPMCKLWMAGINISDYETNIVMGVPDRNKLLRYERQRIHDYLMSALESFDVHRDAKAIAHGLMGLAHKYEMFDDLDKYKERNTSQLYMIHVKLAAKGLFRPAMTELAKYYCLNKEHDKCIAWLSIASKPWFYEDGDSVAIKMLGNVLKGKHPARYIPSDEEMQKAITYSKTLWKNYGLIGIVESYQQLAEASLAKEDYKQSYKYLMQCISETPDNHWCLSLLAHLYFNGYGVSKSKLIAGNFTKRAAENGNIHSMFLLGVMYMYGQAGVSKDLDLATTYLIQAKYYGSLEAQEYLKKLQEMKPSSGS